MAQTGQSAFDHFVFFMNSRKQKPKVWRPEDLEKKKKKKKRESEEGGIEHTNNLWESEAKVNHQPCMVATSFCMLRAPVGGCRPPAPHVISKASSRSRRGEGGRRTCMCMVALPGTELSTGKQKAEARPWEDGRRLVYIPFKPHLACSFHFSSKESLHCVEEKKRGEKPLHTQRGEDF